MLLLTRDGVLLTRDSYYFCFPIRRHSRRVGGQGDAVGLYSGIVMCEFPQVDEAEEYLFASTTTGDVVKVRLNKSSTPGESMSYCHLPPPDHAPAPARPAAPFFLPYTLDRPDTCCYLHVFASSCVHFRSSLQVVASYLQ